MNTRCYSIVTMGQTESGGNQSISMAASYPWVSIKNMENELPLSFQGMIDKKSYGY